MRKAQNDRDIRSVLRKQPPAQKQAEEPTKKWVLSIASIRVLSSCSDSEPLPCCVVTPG